jgi:hypothetical protein
VPLEKDQVAAMLFRGSMPEPGEADIVKGRRRGEGGDMAADVAVLVGAHDHRHGVPADVVVNPDFHVRVAGIFRLPFDRNGVDVFGSGAIGDVDPLLARLCNQAFDQKVGTIGTFLVDHAAKRVCHSWVSWGSASLMLADSAFSGRAAMNLSPDLQNREMKNCTARSFCASNEGNTLLPHAVPQCSKQAYIAL